MPVPRPRVAALQRRLLGWWDAGHRALPWRFPQRAADPYRVWLAEVMLQQTQVATAAPYYLRFVERFPTLEALAAARDEDVLAAWSGLGYYARCRNLLAASREALRRHGGLPASIAQLRALPGFGPYTAGAVASIAFAIPAPAVDGNVVRVLSRLFLVEGDPARRPARARLDALAAALVHPRRPGDLNQALMELGATLCTPGRPACPRCPVAPLCAARAAGRAAALPVARRRAPRPRRTLACAIVERAGRVLLVRRPAGGLFGGLASFPAAELAPAEPAPVVLRREARALHRLRLRTGPELARVERDLTHRRLELRAYRCRLEGEPPPGAAEWVRVEEVPGAGLPSALRALWEAVPAGGAAARREAAPTRSAPAAERTRISSLSPSRRGTRPDSVRRAGRIPAAKLPRSQPA